MTDHDAITPAWKREAWAGDPDYRPGGPMASAARGIEDGPEPERTTSPRPSSTTRAALRKARNLAAADLQQLRKAGRKQSPTGAHPKKRRRDGV